MSEAGTGPTTDSVGRLTARVLELGPVRWLKPILDDYSAAGGGLLATGLAFNSLFAVLPAILLLVAILGLFLNDPIRLDQVVNALSGRFPPLREFFRQALAQLSGGAISLSVIGLIGLIWGSSRFYQALDDAIARIFRGSRQRDPLRRAVRGIVSVGLLIGSVALAVTLGQLAEDLGTRQPLVSAAVTAIGSALGSALGTVAAFSVAIALLYRMVPTDTPSWTAIGRPAVVVGLVLTILTGVFALITPRLIGSLQVYAAFVTVFAAMIWLSYVAQTILIGAAWVHRRMSPRDGGSLGTAG